MVLQGTTEMAAPETSQVAKITADVRDAVRIASHETAHASQQLNAQAENRVNAVLAGRSAGSAK